MPGPAGVAVSWAVGAGAGGRGWGGGWVSILRLTAECGPEPFKANSLEILSGSRSYFLSIYKLD